MRTHNIGFYEDKTKLSFSYHRISSNTHLISSSGKDIEKGADKTANCYSV